jgi:hypothetical protein
VKTPVERGLTSFFPNGEKPTVEPGSASSIEEAKKETEALQVRERIKTLKETEEDLDRSIAEMKSRLLDSVTSEMGMANAFVYASDLTDFLSLGEGEKAQQQQLLLVHSPTGATCQVSTFAANPASEIGTTNRSRYQVEIHGKPGPNRQPGALQIHLLAEQPSSSGGSIGKRETIEQADLNGKEQTKKVGAGQADSEQAEGGASSSPSSLLVLQQLWNTRMHPRNDEVKMAYVSSRREAHTEYSCRVPDVSLPLEHEKVNEGGGEQRGGSGGVGGGAKEGGVKSGGVEGGGGAEGKGQSEDMEVDCVADDGTGDSSSGASSGSSSSSSSGSDSSSIVPSSSEPWVVYTDAFTGMEYFEEQHALKEAAAAAAGDDGNSTPMKTSSSSSSSSSGNSTNSSVVTRENSSVVWMRTSPYMQPSPSRSIERGVSPAKNNCGVNGGMVNGGMAVEGGVAESPVASKGGSEGASERGDKPEGGNDGAGATPEGAAQQGTAQHGAVAAAVPGAMPVKQEVKQEAAVSEVSEQPVGQEPQEYLGSPPQAMVIPFLRDITIGSNGGTPAPGRKGYTICPHCNNTFHNKGFQRHLTSCSNTYRTLGGALLTPPAESSMDFGSANGHSPVPWAREKGHRTIMLKPPKPVSAFTLFCQANRNRVTDQLRLLTDSPSAGAGTGIVDAAAATAAATATAADGSSTSADAGSAVVAVTVETDTAVVGSAAAGGTADGATVDTGLTEEGGGAAAATRKRKRTEGDKGTGDDESDAPPVKVGRAEAANGTAVANGVEEYNISGLGKVAIPKLTVEVTRLLAEVWSTQLSVQVGTGYESGCLLIAN